MSESATPRRSDWVRILAVALPALWLTRAAIALSLGDVFGYEESDKAALGRAMFDGLGVDHHRFAYVYYEFGGFVFSHLDALFFALFGSSVATVKLVALTWQSAMLAVIVALALRAHGARAAAFSALLWILAAESVQKLSLLALGIHFESLLFHAWILLEGGRIALDGERAPRRWLGLGLAMGLGFAFNLTTLAGIACAGIGLLAFARKDLFGRGGAWGTLGAAVGLSPWLWMVSRVGDGVFDLHGESLGAGRAWSEVFGNLATFARQVAFDRPWLDQLDLLLRALIAVAAVVVLLRARAPRRAWSAWLVAHLACFALAYLASRLAVGAVPHYNSFERALPAILPITLLSAAACAQGTLSPQRATRALGWAAIGVLTLFGLRSFARSLGEVGPARWIETAGHLRAVSGCTYSKSLPLFFENLEGEDLDRYRLLLRLREPKPVRLESQLAMAVITAKVWGLRDALALCREIDSTRWRGLALGLGPCLSRETGRDLKRVASVLEAYAEEERTILYEAGARLGRGYFVTWASLSAEIADASAAALPDAWFEGLGWRMNLIHFEEMHPVYHRLRPVHPKFDPIAAERFLAEQPHQHQAALRRGFERALDELAPWNP